MDMDMELELVHWIAFTGSGKVFILDFVDLDQVKVHTSKSVYIVYTKRSFLTKDTLNEI
jgi:hypothetical protein